jgi:hypothetical protein
MCDRLQFSTICGHSDSSTSIPRKPDHVARIACHEDVLHVFAVRSAVEWRVRLQEAPMGLHLRHREGIGFRHEPELRPRGVFLPEDVRIPLKNKLTDDLLHPRRAALRPGVDQDVAGTEGKIVEARGIPNCPLLFGCFTRQLGRALCHRKPHIQSSSCAYSRYYGNQPSLGTKNESLTSRDGRA